MRGKKMMKQRYTRQQIDFIIKLREKNQLSWADVADTYNKVFNTLKTADAVRKVYAAEATQEEINIEEKLDASILVSAARQQKAKTLSNKKLKIAVDRLVSQEDLLEAIKKANKELTFTKLPKVSLKKSKTKANMTMELMLSDLHYGKKTQTFNNEIAQRRMKELTSVFIQEAEMKKKHYNVEKFVIALIGDIIESYTMHNLESAQSCEFGNSKQVVEAVKGIWRDCLFPLLTYASKNGIKVVVPAVTGNHDRTEQKRTYNNPGLNNVTFIIYNQLKEYCNLISADVEFIIPHGSYCLIDIYGSKVLYEHGDNFKNSAKALEDHIAKRAQQEKCHIEFIRYGHYHEYLVFGRGRAIGNGSLPGEDSFSKVLGFDSHACQVINYYIETKERPNPFYASFPVYLE